MQRFKLDNNPHESMSYVTLYNAEGEPFYFGKMIDLINEVECFVRQGITKEVIRSENLTCARCKKQVRTFWGYAGSQCKGLISDPRYVLAGDWVYHADCWDELIKEHPP